MSVNRSFGSADRQLYFHQVRRVNTTLRDAFSSEKASESLRPKVGASGSLIRRKWKDNITNLNVDY